MFRDQPHCAPEDDKGSGGAPAPEPKPEPEKKTEPAPEKKLEPFVAPNRSEVSAASESTMHALLDELRIFNGTKKEKLPSLGPTDPAPAPAPGEKKPDAKKPERKKLGWFEF